MDTSYSDLPLDLGALRKALARRSDAYWELLATAVGVKDALAKTLRGLTANQLTLGANGDSIAPSIVKERIEALAAYNPIYLTYLSQGWKTPNQIRNDPFWTAAWKESIRHLKKLDVITYSQVAVPELETEVKLLWNTSSAQPISWRAVTAEFKNHFIPYSLIRKYSNCSLVEKFLTAEDIEQAPMLLLRILRGREQILDASASAVIANKAKQVLDQDPFEAALIIETCQTIRLDVLPDIRLELSQRLEHVKDPRDVIPLAYVLLNTEWRIP